jgi:hypothetical protein
MDNKKQSAISRREFARRAAMVSAAASLNSADLMSPEPPSPPPVPQQLPAGHKLSPESHREVESRIHSILEQYGSRLSGAQKADIRRLATEAQLPLERLRTYTVENGDGPGLYLKPLIEREKKLAQASPILKSANAPKNS